MVQTRNGAIKLRPIGRAIYCAKRYNDMIGIHGNAMLLLFVNGEVVAQDYHLDKLIKLSRRFSRNQIEQDKPRNCVIKTGRGVVVYECEYILSARKKVRND